MNRLTRACFLVQTTKEVLADDVLPGGIAVKKGDAVQYMTYSMSRMPFIWGSDALEMKPKRWLKNGVYQSVSTFQFSVFQVNSKHPHY